MPTAEIDGADSVEDDGAIPLANPVGGLPPVTKSFSSGVIGDGPRGSGGSGNGDFDFFELPGLLTGQILVVDVDTPVPFGNLDPFVVLWDSTGAVIAFNDDDGQSFDSLLALTIPADGDYYVSIGGFGSFAPIDPFDSASGLGAGSEGDYEVSFSNTTSIDYYAVDLRLGDVLGASVVGGQEAALFAPDDTLLVGTQGDPSFIYPAASFLPGCGPSISYVATQNGRFTVRVTTNSDYDLDIRVFRPGLSPVASRQRQTLFIDFDGAEIDTTIFGVSGIPQPRTLSPLANFLGLWGLGLSDEDAVIDAILDTVWENLAEDLADFGLNGDRDSTGNPTEFAIEILNSRDHDDPFGARNVSRVIVGGTFGELGFITIGIAESIDPGNFARSETAVVLLDTLSAPLGIAGLFNLNNITLAPPATIVDLIGVAVGNIVAHEAGHYFGDWHTDQFNPKAEIMDQGGNAISTFGLGPDVTFGTPDDVDVDFDLDVYVPNEGFVGIEDTLNRTAFGLSTGRRKGGQ